MTFEYTHKQKIALIQEMLTRLEENPSWMPRGELRCKGRLASIEYWHRGGDEGQTLIQRFDEFPIRHSIDTAFFNPWWLLGRKELRVFSNRKGNRCDISVYVWPWSLLARRFGAAWNGLALRGLVVDSEREEKQSFIDAVLGKND